MAKSFEAIFKKGVLKPLTVIDLKENEKVKIVIETIENVARDTSGMIRGLDDDIIDEIALSLEYGSLED